MLGLSILKRYAIHHVGDSRPQDFSLYCLASTVKTKIFYSIWWGQFGPTHQSQYQRRSSRSSQHLPPTKARFGLKYRDCYAVLPTKEEKMSLMTGPRPSTGIQIRWSNVCHHIKDLEINHPEHSYTLGKLSWHFLVNLFMLPISVFPGILCLTG